MLSSPYPVPNDPLWRAIMVAGALGGVASGIWVLASPPQSYAALDGPVSVLWGVLLIVGSVSVLAGIILRRYRIEMAGLWPALAGVFLYAGLSWNSTLTTSPGAGARACLIVMLACWIGGRLRQLHLVDKKVRRMDALGTGG